MFQVDEIIAEVDADGDGDINYDEFAKMVAPSVAKGNKV